MFCLGHGYRLYSLTAGSELVALVVGFVLGACFLSVLVVFAAWVRTRRSSVGSVS